MVVRMKVDVFAEPEPSPQAGLYLKRFNFTTASGCFTNKREDAMTWPTLEEALAFWRTPSPAGKDNRPLCRLNVALLVGQA